jgi:hypothetical protein
MPRWPEKSLNAAEQDVGKQADLIIPATGQIVRDDNSIEVMDRPLTNDLADSMAFMEEKVEVMVHESTDQNAENPVQVSCNGINQFFFRGQPQEVRRKFIEILARAKTTSIATHERRDHQGDMSFRIARATALRYPFSVIRDENPKGSTWLRKILQEG